MLADDVACNPRNHFPATGTHYALMDPPLPISHLSLVYNNAGRYIDLYGKNIEVDYRGYEVTVEAFIRLLTNRVDPLVPRYHLLSLGNTCVYFYRSKRLNTDDRVLAPSNSLTD